MANKLVVLKPQRLRSLRFFLFFLPPSIVGEFHLDHLRLSPGTAVSSVQVSYNVEFSQLGAWMTFVDTNSYYVSLCCTCYEVCSCMVPLQ